MSAPRFQLCGRPSIEIDGQSRDALVPGAQGQRLFAFLSSTARDR